MVDRMDMEWVVYAVFVHVGAVLLVSLLGGLVVFLI